MIKQRSLLTYILLNLVTCGIYSIFFWYGYVEDINKVCEGDGKESPNFIIVLLLSFITCGIYGLIWYYIQGNRLQENAPRYNLSFSEGGTAVLLWMTLGSIIVVGPFIGMYILINNLNALGSVYNTRSQGHM